MGQITGSVTTGSILNSDIIPSAGVSASKCEHQNVHVIDWEYGDADGSVATEEHTFFMASGAGTIREVKIWLVDSGTNTSIAFDLEVGGVSILTGDINIVHGTGDQVAVSGVISSGALVAGDPVTAVIKTVTQNTGALGPRMQVTIDTSYV